MKRELYLEKVKAPALGRYKEVARLRAQGLSFPKIANHLGVSYPRARALYAKAKREGLA